MSTTIKAILFDLGNVIIRFDPEILEKAYSTHGKIKKGAIVEYLLDSENVNKYMEGKLTNRQFYLRTSRLFRMDIKFGEFFHKWNSIFFPYPEVEEIIRTLKKKYPEIKLILLSNTNETHYEFLRKEYNILDVLDAHVVSHEVGKQKPHPEIFREALRLAGSISKDTFYTDDRLDLIERARTMGIRAYQFTGHEELKKQLAKYDIIV